MSLDILLSGSSGFLGKHLKTALLSNNVKTIGRGNSDFLFDLREQIIPLPYFDIIIHAAGKAHSYPKSSQEIQEFYDVNYYGTINFLKALDDNPPSKFVFISSVSVYGLSNGKLIDEKTKLLASDAYGESKLLAEKVVESWCYKKKVQLTILRLPLLVGANPPGNLGRMFKGIRHCYYFNIGGGMAKKSMVLAEDVANHIISIAGVGGIFNLTDGYNPSYRELSYAIAKHYGRLFVPNIPFIFAIILSKIGDCFGPNFPFNSQKFGKLSSELTFSSDKAKLEFGWNPRCVLKEITQFF